MEAIVLRSTDGQDYSAVVLFNPGRNGGNLEFTMEELVRIMESVQAANRNEWDFNELKLALIQAGFVVPVVHHGPYWDAE